MIHNLDLPKVWKMVLNLDLPKVCKMIHTFDLPKVRKMSSLRQSVLESIYPRSNRSAALK